MSAKDSAFPLQDSLHDEVGLTKREVMAMAAMQGLLAEDALAHADALIAALEQTK